MHLTVKRSLFLSFTAIVLIIIFLSITTIRGNSREGQIIRKVNDATLPYAMDFLELENEVLRIQQWLSGISASRAAFGLDEGFQEAKTSYDNALSIIEELISLHKNDTVMLPQLNILKTDLSDYYESGRLMAQTYIAGGPEIGNPMMESFNPKSAKLQKELQALTERHLDELNFEFSSLAAAGERLTIAALCSGLIAVIIGVSIGFLTARRINSGISVIQSFSENLKTGILNQNITLKQQDEFGKLTADFNSSFNSLRELIQQTGTSVEQSLKINDHLTESSSAVSASLTEMNSGMIAMSDQLENQDDAISNAAASMNQIASSITSLTNQIDNQSSAVSESSAAVEEMAASINNVSRISQERSGDIGVLLDLLKSSSSNLEITNDDIQQVARLSEALLDITDVINGIASQTNLLAMNAAIEAAHAGNAGRGFAVVSEEIRKLAEETSDNSSRISSTLNQISSIVQSARNSSIENQINFQKVETEVEGFTDTFQEINSTMAELSTGTSEIIGAVSSLSEITAGIQSASGEMSRGTADVNNSMKSVKQLSGSVLGEIRKINDEINGINNAMESLGEVSEESRESTLTIQGTIDKFAV